MVYVGDVANIVNTVLAEVGYDGTVEIGVGEDGRMMVY